MNDIANATNEIVDAKDLIIGEAAALEQARLDAIASVSGHVSGAMAKLCPINFMLDSGRLYDRSAAGTVNYVQLDDQYQAHLERMTPYNGATFSHVGKYRSGSVSHGGADVANEQTVVDLLNKMRASDPLRKHGVEFNVGELQCGSGVVAPYSGYYLAMGLNSFPSPPETTIMFYMRCVEGDCYRHSGFVDGVADGDRLLPVEEGWIHFAKNYDVFSGYLSSLPIYGTEGSRIQLALPALVAGDYRGYMHTAPIPSIVDGA